MQSLLYSRKFWLAVFGICQTLLFHFLPDFPKDIWVSINVLVGVLIASIAIEDAAEKSAPVTIVHQGEDDDPEPGQP